MIENKHTSEVFNEDCMVGMARYPDKYFDLAVVDPPYRDKNQPTKGMRAKINGKMKNFGGKPSVDFFVELFRISANQIVWGANNFTSLLPESNGWIFWYKRNPMPNYSDGELAWTSFDVVTRCLPLDHFGAHTSDKDKIHPTQKPVALYDWIYKNYLPNGGKVIDTHLGSGSNRIAANKAGNIDFTGFELDKDYYEAQEKRWKAFISQTRLF